MESLGFCLGFLLGVLSATAMIFFAYKIMQIEFKGVEFRPMLPDNISKTGTSVYTTGGKHIPKVRDDVEARKQEIKKADEGNMKYGN